MCITEACFPKSLPTQTRGSRAFQSTTVTQIQPLLAQHSAKVHGNYNHATQALQSTRLIGFITHISLGPPKFNGCLTCYCFFFPGPKFVPFSARDANQINMQMIIINQSALSPGAPDSQAPLLTSRASLRPLLVFTRERDMRCCILRFELHETSSGL